MKFKLIFSAFILLSFQAFSQTKNNISILYGIAANDGDNHGVKGDYGYSPQSGLAYGFSYTRNLTRSFSLETGLLYSINKVELHTSGPRGGIFDQNSNLLSIPLYAKKSFLKYFFAQWGLSFDHQTNYSSGSIIDDQSGIGIALGIGGRYNIGQTSVFINPFFCRHALNAQNNLVETGIKFGIGYNF
ncbi:MAG: outer membrane beta-barrel protein [Mucilaginibacter sp.]